MTRREEFQEQQQELNGHNQQQELNSHNPDCRKMLRKWFDYGIVSIVVIALLFIFLCLSIFARPKTNPVSLRIEKARFQICTQGEIPSDLVDRLQMQQFNSDRSNTTLPPLDEMQDGSGEINV